MPWKRGHAEASSGAVAQVDVSDVWADQLSAAVVDDDRRGLDGRKLYGVLANPRAICSVSGWAAGRALSRSGVQGVAGGQSVLGRSPTRSPERNEASAPGVVETAITRPPMHGCSPALGPPG